ncbi:Threonine--tRNA ligase 1 [Bacillus licheniformis]|nr:TGS domain-containing protein [Bacillus sp. AG442]TWK01537.1 Threonine--tRNA ligase 1 [Bacillus licheniformis]TWK12076.1 Threonine--tRNA ligase 1 [Bacillus licheniformis]TWK72245.1 Threonine--tRNA ligase 1 [Bacillus licheniformis]TWK99096.1 Threonine--tRNA ligase 1 [Bacillus licheniformis]
MSIRIKLPDGSVREFEEEASIEDVAASISCGLEHAVAGKLNGKLVDLSTPLQDGALVEIVTRDSADRSCVKNRGGKGVLWHLTQHGDWRSSGCICSTSP